MITLRKWFYRKTRFPILLTIVLMILSMITYFWHWHTTHRKTQVERAKQIVGLASLAIAQKDRTLLESSLRIGLSSLKAREIILCKNDTVLVSHPTLEASCAIKYIPFTRLVQLPAVGMPNFRFLFYLSVFPDRSSFWLIFLLSGSFLFGGVLLLIQLYQRVQKELLCPLLSHLSRPEPLEIIELEELRRNNTELGLLREQEAVTRALYEKGEQIAHDIRSPLNSLDAALNMIKNMPDRPRRILEHVSHRIHGLADNLLGQSVGETDGTNINTSSEKARVESILPLVSALVTEKRIQYQHRKVIEIETSFQLPYSTFAMIERGEMARVLSNVIDNAIEAISDSGKVTVGLGEDGNLIRVEISDTGQGISSELLPRLMHKGETFGKKGGRGLGLYLSRLTLERWGGTIKITSTLGLGTTVLIQLPISKPPEWFVPKVRLMSGTTVIIVDDDKSSHERWDFLLSPKMSEKGKGIAVEHYYDASSLFEGRKNNRNWENLLFLIDHDLSGWGISGPELVERLHIFRESIYLTSRPNLEEILEGGITSGVPTIPKDAASDISVEYLEKKDEPDAVLIDDDPAIREIWTEGAETSGQKLWTFVTPGEFLGSKSAISINVPIYIDSRLDSVDGIAFARTLHGLGYRHIAITTALPLANVRNEEWLSEIRGKEPPRVLGLLNGSSITAR